MLWFCHDSVLGQDTSESKPRAWETHEIHVYVSCRRDITEIMLKTAKRTF